jgi:antitoxin component of MazEF toxin-antitoxin module
MTKEQFIRTIRKSGTSLAIHIPPEIITLLKLKERDIVKIEIEKKPR